MKSLSYFFFFVLIFGYFMSGTSLYTTDAEYYDFYPNTSTNSINGINETTTMMPPLEPIVSDNLTVCYHDESEATAKLCLWPKYVQQIYKIGTWTTLGLYWFLSILMITCMFVCCYPVALKRDTSESEEEEESDSPKKVTKRKRKGTKK